ncbi:hypothetical protein TIFTF001_028106, partial [Ficus carica]
MDSDRGKRHINEVVVDWTRSDSDDSSSDDDEWPSAIRRSRFEFESHQSRRGTETNNEAIERNRKATTSGTGILSIPQIARLSKPPRRISVELFLRTSNPRFVLTDEDFSGIRGRYGFLNEVQLRLPFPDERADTVSEGWICMYTIQSMHHYQLAIPQLMPN